MNPRSAWRPSHGQGLRTSRPQSRVVIHHAPERKLKALPTEEDIGEQIRIIERWHAQVLTPTNPRIGYHWIVVDQDASIWEGLGWDRIGAHVANHNTSSLGILLLGLDGADSSGRRDVWSSVARLVKTGIERGSLVARPEIVPHRRLVATECPGDRLASFVEALSLEDLLNFADPLPRIEMPGWEGILGENPIERPRRVELRLNEPPPPRLMPRARETTGDWYCRLLDELVETVQLPWWLPVGTVMKEIKKVLGCST